MPTTTQAIYPWSLCSEVVNSNKKLPVRAMTGVLFFRSREKGRANKKHVIYKVSSRSLASRPFSDWRENQWHVTSPDCRQSRLGSPQWKLWRRRWWLVLDFLGNCSHQVSSMLETVGWKKINFRMTYVYMSCKVACVSGTERQVTGMIEGFFWVWNFRFLGFFE